ncbi:MAG TPA: DUF1416 domain-containing protein [Actinomycetota bacterium]|nr:DUF1416 domain-containing protein [Actinomycetota bacterium]
MTVLKGRITVHGSRPATTAVVELHNPQGDVLDQVQVDEDGYYTYHLVPGGWVLNVWDAHGHRGRAQVDLPQSNTDFVVDVDLEEPPEGHG